MNLRAPQLSRRLALAGALALLGGCAMMDNMMGGGNTVRLAGTLNAAQEVPPSTSTGSGSVSASYDKNSSKLTYEVTYSGLTGPATAGHFHGPAAPGQNAGVVLPFPNATSPIRGEATLTAAQAADLLAGRWYANIHTARHPGGEIRGQVVAR
jgi:hypothetical protein